MNHRPACTVLLAAGLALSASTARHPVDGCPDPGRVPDTSASVASQPVQRDAEPSTVRSLAQLCIDPRHVALVSNALRHGRVITLAEARSWCDD